MVGKNLRCFFFVVCRRFVFWENHWLRGQQWLDSCFGTTVRHTYIDLLGEGNFSWMFLKPVVLHHLGSPVSWRAIGQGC